MAAGVFLVEMVRLSSARGGESWSQEWMRFHDRFRSFASGRPEISIFVYCVYAMCPCFFVPFSRCSGTRIEDGVRAPQYPTDHEVVSYQDTPLAWSDVLHVCVCNL